MIVSFSVVIKLFQTFRRGRNIILFAQNLGSNSYCNALELTLSYVKYYDYSKNVISFIVLFLLLVLRDFYLMMPFGIIGYLRV